MDDKKLPKKEEDKNMEDLPGKINLLNEFHAHVLNPESIPGGEFTNLNELNIEDII